jgi:osmotically-inducible protein OsmY
MARTFLDDGRIEFRPRDQQASGLESRRTDERIRARLRERLASAGIDCREVAITVAGGVVRLVGSAPSTRTKQAIEQAAARCAGVREVDNRMRLRRLAPGRSD